MARTVNLIALLVCAVGCGESRLETEYRLTLEKLEKKQIQTQTQFNNEAIRQLKEMRANAEAMNEAMLAEALEIAKAKGQVEVDAFLSQRQEKVEQLRQEVNFRQKEYDGLKEEIEVLKKRLSEIDRKLGRTPTRVNAANND